MLAKFYGNVRLQRRITIPGVTKRHEIFYEIGIRHASKQPLPASLLIKFFRHIVALLLNQRSNKFPYNVRNTWSSSDNSLAATNSRRSTVRMKIHARLDKCSNLILQKEIEVSNEISLFPIFVLFSAIESVWPHWYHELRTLYSSIN